MSREAAIKEIDEQLEKLGEETEKETVEEIEDKEVEETEAEETEEVEAPVKDEPREEIKKEVVAEERPKLKLAEAQELPAATLGYKLREKERELERIKAENAELRAPKVSKEENYEGYVENELGVTKQDVAELKAWKQEQESNRQAEAEREGAFQELAGYETEAAQAFPDYDKASTHVKTMIATAIKTLNPSIANKDLAEQTVMKYAQYAGQALAKKKHPGEAIYEMAAQWGYKEAPAAQEDRPKIEKIPLSKLADNKKKSAGMNGNGGNGKAFMTMDAVASMSNAERMKLTESDWARLESEG